MFLEDREPLLPRFEDDVENRWMPCVRELAKNGDEGGLERLRVLLLVPREEIEASAGLLEGLVSWFSCCLGD